MLLCTAPLGISISVEYESFRVVLHKIVFRVLAKKKSPQELTANFEYLPIGVYHPKLNFAVLFLVIVPLNKGVATKI